MRLYGFSSFGWLLALALRNESGADYSPGPVRGGGPAAVAFAAVCVDTVLLLLFFAVRRPGEGVRLWAST